MATISQFTPLPTLGDGEGRGELLIMGLRGSCFGLFGAFDFAFGDKTVFLGADAFEKDRGRFIIRVLRHKLTAYGKVKYLLT